MRLLSLITIALVCATVSASAQDKEKGKGKEERKEKGPIHHVDAKTAASKLAEKDGMKVIDIRTVKEFDEGHLKGAKQIDFLRDDFEKELAKLDRDTPYLVHCRSGGRSTRSLDVWKKLGFKRIYHLDGGIIAWEKAKLPVVK